MTATLPPGYPLAWPDGWARTPLHLRQRSKYSVTPGKAKDEVLSSLALLGARRSNQHPYPLHAVISSNIALRNDGLPRADAREPVDPGIAVWWIDGRTGALRSMACDAWRTTRENLRAIGLALEGMRAIERSKATQILDRAMQSFNMPALPAGRPWFCEELGLDHWPATASEVEEAWRQRRLTAHPDRGGSHEQFIKVGQARDEALRALGAGGAR